MMLNGLEFGQVGICGLEEQKDNKATKEGRKKNIEMRREYSNFYMCKRGDCLCTVVSPIHPARRNHILRTL